MEAEAMSHSLDSRDGERREHQRMTGSTCPCCGEQCERDSVHNGVAMLYGPYGCSSCGYSEWPEYDCREEWARGEAKLEDGHALDPRGGLTPNRGSL